MPKFAKAGSESTSKTGAATPENEEKKVSIDDIRAAIKSNQIDIACRTEAEYAKHHRKRENPTIKPEISVPEHITLDDVRSAIESAQADISRRNEEESAKSANMSASKDALTLISTREVDAISKKIAEAERLATEYKALAGALFVGTVICMSGLLTGNPYAMISSLALTMVCAQSLFHCLGAARAEDERKKALQKSPQ
jgi:uncharacterized small protein (DUF1192 family)